MDDAHVPGIKAFQQSPGRGRGRRDSAVVQFNERLDAMVGSPLGHPFEVPPGRLKQDRVRGPAGPVIAPACRTERRRGDADLAASQGGSSREHTFDVVVVVAPRVAADSGDFQAGVARYRCHTLQVPFEAGERNGCLVAGPEAWFRRLRLVRDPPFDAVPALRGKVGDGFLGGPVRRGGCKYGKFHCFRGFLSKWCPYGLQGRCTCRPGRRRTGPPGSAWPTHRRLARWPGR